ncbi:MAG: dihydroxyacetone kinase subunit L [Corynebacterium pyruviciproducens]|uniref:dihydroxyacetone kinase subunit L n=1 Tax=Corynebacterium pyruviciproducens TaxID=598660 RepID=UPI003983A87A
MIDKTKVAEGAVAISREMTANRDYLIKLDQVNGDGDLGISMDDGFRSLASFLEESQESDLGQLLRKASRVMNDSAPSSLGTIISFFLMGMAKALKGKDEVSFSEFADAFRNGVDNLMEKAGSTRGEKTIVDSLCPGVEALQTYSDEPLKAIQMACSASHKGAESTKEMKAVHGRAAFTASRSLGVLDGGSVVGSLIFKALYDQFGKE